MSDAGTAQVAFEALKRNFDMALQHAAHTQYHINVARQDYLRAQAMRDANLLGKAHEHVVDAYEGFLSYANAIEPCGRGFAQIVAGELGGDELQNFLADINGVPDDVDAATGPFHNELIKVATILGRMAGNHHDVESARTKLGKSIKLLPMVCEKASAAKTALENFRQAIAI